MMKRVVFATVIATLCACPAAFAAPADKEACNKAAFELADKASKQKLAEAQAAKVDTLLSKMEDECKDDKLTDADATAKQVEDAIAGK
jgi:hypothetical protein